MFLRLLVDWGSVAHPWQPAGSLLDVDNALGRQLLFGGLAERVAMPDLQTAEAPVRAVAARKRKRRK